MSNRPKPSSTVRTALATLAWSVISILICRTLGKLFPTAAAAFTMALSVWVESDLAPMAIRDAPARAYDTAMARPIPFEAPQMKTCLPSRLVLLESIA